MRLLLVDDNERLSRLIGASLAKAGFETDVVAMAAEAAAAVESVVYSAVILDLGLPDQDGLILLKRLRASGNALPILILTARGGIEDRVRGLDAGADDYLVKPFAQEELIARLRAILRRPGGLLGGALELGTLRLDTVSRQVTLGKPPNSFLLVRSQFWKSSSGAVVAWYLRRSSKIICSAYPATSNPTPLKSMCTDCANSWSRREPT